MPLLRVESSQTYQCLPEETKAFLGEARGVRGVREERRNEGAEALRMVRREK